jgi:purine-binding chemotaxis protein CheW
MSVNEITTPLLTFRLARQLYCLPIANLVEVAAILSLEALPDAPDALLGIANRHGEILPVLDLRIAFKTERSPITASTLFIVAEHHGQMLGLVVDEIFQVIYVNPKALKPAGTSSRFVSHLLNHESKLYQRIDVKALLAAYLTISPT